MSVVYVVSAAWRDGSGSAPVSAHWSLEAAEMMRSVLEAHGDSGKEYKVHPIPCEPLP